MQRTEKEMKQMQNNTYVVTASLYRSFDTVSFFWHIFPVEAIFNSSLTCKNTDRKAVIGIPVLLMLRTVKPAKEFTNSILKLPSYEMKH